MVRNFPEYWCLLSYLIEKQGNRTDIINDEQQIALDENMPTAAHICRVIDKFGHNDMIENSTFRILASAPLVDVSSEDEYRRVLLYCTNEALKDGVSRARFYDSLNALKMQLDGKLAEFLGCFNPLFHNLEESIRLAGTMGTIGDVQDNDENPAISKISKMLDILSWTAFHLTDEKQGSDLWNSAGPSSTPSSHESISSIHVSISTFVITCLHHSDEEIRAKAMKCIASFASIGIANTHTHVSGTSTFSKKLFTYLERALYFESMKGREVAIGCIFDVLYRQPNLANENSRTCLSLSLSTSTDTDTSLLLSESVRHDDVEEDEDVTTTEVSDSGVSVIDTLFEFLNGPTASIRVITTAGLSRLLLHGKIRDDDIEKCIEALVWKALAKNEPENIEAKMDLRNTTKADQACDLARHFFTLFKEGQSNQIAIANTITFMLINASQSQIEQLLTITSQRKEKDKHTHYFSFYHANAFNYLVSMLHSDVIPVLVQSVKENMEGRLRAEIDEERVCAWLGIDVEY